MSQRAIGILSRWVAETVRPVPAAERPKEAARLAAEFAAYAADAGLNLQKLEEDLGEDLPSFMSDALEAAEETESGGPEAD